MTGGTWTPSEAGRVKEKEIMVKEISRKEKERVRGLTLEVVRIMGVKEKEKVRAKVKVRERIIPRERERAEGREL